MSNDVVIWTEGGERIGIGHVMRSLNVARALRHLGAGVSFLVNNDPTAIEMVEKAGFPFSISPLEAEGCGDVDARVVLIDSKDDLTELVGSLKAAGKRVVLLDNSTDAAGVADMVIIPAPFLAHKPLARSLIHGSEYIPVGESFVRARARRAIAYGLPLKVLVTMGGADPNGLTLKVVEALDGMETIEVTVIIGPAFKQEQVEALGRFEDDEDKRFTFLTGVNDLAPLMLKSHVAFTAMGTTIYELACTGVPPVVIANYRSDEPDLEGIEALGFGLTLGYHNDISAETIRRGVEFFMEDPGAWEDMSSRASALVDGRGAERIAGKVTALLET